jgi:A/G-specific adenine glycosylase
MDHRSPRHARPAGSGPTAIAADRRHAAAPTPDAADLLAWYDGARRDLPWRAPAGAPPADPYAVWLSEVMLQQTTVAAVAPYYARFLARWPTVADLAAAPDDAVMAAWAGLGYYSRARNLLAAARAVVRDHDGRFPASVAALRALPGVGAYTAAAVAAIAFDLPAVPVDGNVERVTSRLHRVATPLPKARGEIAALIGALAPAGRHGDFAQALMDLGATICTPRRPSCPLCPWRPACAAARAGDAEAFPVKAAKAERPTRRGIAYVARRADGAVLLGRRRQTGLLAGMAEVPGSDWTTETPTPAPPLAAHWRRVAGPVVHVFTHFRLDLEVETADLPIDTPAPAGLWWSGANARAGEALPTVMAKAIAHALGEPRPAGPAAATGKRRRGTP